jgi:hypothetical protein
VSVKAMLIRRKPQWCVRVFVLASHPSPFHLRAAPSDAHVFVYPDLCTSPRLEDGVDVLVGFLA